MLELKLEKNNVTKEFSVKFIIKLPDRTEPVDIPLKKGLEEVMNFFKFQSTRNQH